MIPREILKKNRQIELRSNRVARTQTILCFVWGLVCIYCLFIPYGLLAAWGGLNLFSGDNWSWFQLAEGVLMTSLYAFVARWYFTLPLAAAVAWCLYLRKQARALPRSKPNQPAA